jgi:O-antigen/teichoic acid export membrane protein
MAHRNPLFSLLFLTLSIQGLSIAAQVVVAILVGPTTLGDIRWLESVFTILLLATSCGMPSLVFRQSALIPRAESALSFAVIALTLTTIISIAVLLSGGFIALIGMMPTIPTQTFSLLLIATAVIPANIIRILIACAQGAELTHRIYIQVLVFSFGAVLTLAYFTFLFEVKGWAAARCIIELVMAMYIWRLLRQLMRGSSDFKTPTLKVLSETCVKGMGANFTFLVRALADNLPILVLYNFVSVYDEVGLYSFASLLIFGPMLLLSTVMQAELPKLIKSVNDRNLFNKCCKDASRKIFLITTVGILIVFAMCIVLHLNDYFGQYGGAVTPLILLTAALPARGFLLLAGGALVARGWFAISSLISLSEIMCLLSLFIAGLIDDAYSMAIGVVITTWFAALPGYFLLRSAKKIPILLQ